jgi:hypothetical protein
VERGWLVGLHPICYQGDWMTAGWRYLAERRFPYLAMIGRIDSEVEAAHFWPASESGGWEQRMSGADITRKSPIPAKEVRWWPAKGVLWWAACLVIVMGDMLYDMMTHRFEGHRVPVWVISLTFLSTALGLSICVWWYRQSKLLGRRSVVLRIPGNILFGIGTLLLAYDPQQLMIEAFWFLYPEDGRSPQDLSPYGIFMLNLPEILVPAAMIIVAYFMVFRSRRTSSTIERHLERADDET